MGAPSNNFASARVRALGRDPVGRPATPIGNTTYDLPTLDDEDRAGDPDANDPFGGNDGKNQAKLVPGGPVQVYAPGLPQPLRPRAHAERARCTPIDNGANAGWGDVPVSEGPGGTCTNARATSRGRPTRDTLHLITGAGYYGGHPNPTRGNTANTFNGATRSRRSPAPTRSSATTASRRPAAATSLADVPGLDQRPDRVHRVELRRRDEGRPAQPPASTTTIYRIELNARRHGRSPKPSRCSRTSGGGPLDVDAPAATAAPFPGTIWVGRPRQRRRSTSSSPTTSAARRRRAPAPTSRRSTRTATATRTPTRSTTARTRARRPTSRRTGTATTISDLQRPRRRQRRAARHVGSRSRSTPTTACDHDAARRPTRGRTTRPTPAACSTSASPA